MEAIAAENDLTLEAVAEFERARPTRVSWLDQTRRKAFDRFVELGFPTPSDEEWKYTSVSPITRVPFRLAAGDALYRGPDPPPAASAGARIVFVNGRFEQSLSSQGPSREGLEVSPLKEALEKNPDALRPHLARHAGFEASAFTALNTALFQDGAFLRIADGAILSDPIEIIFLSEATQGPTVSHPRTLILAGAGSQATVVETYLGDQNPYFTNAVTEIVCEDGAILQHYKLQREGGAGFHVQTIQVRQERSSSFTSHNVAFGAALARTNLSVLFAGEGGECALNGIFVGGGRQHLDNHTTIDHARPHCASRELYKGILDGRARGVFYGKIIVRPDAQKTDAMQTNKNLLLSREALVNSTPALEILADDVKCRHGSTIGQLDAAALFYLRSRGIGESEARALMTYAFAADVAERMKVAAVREAVERFLGGRLTRATEAE